MSARVCLVLGAPVSRSPRAVKEAAALHAAGYQVVVLGPVFSQATLDADAALAAAAGWAHRVSADLRPGARGQWRTRTRHRAAREVVRVTGLQVAGSLGYGVRSTLAAARQVGAELYIGHNEVGLWVTDRLASEGRRVGVDLEDWYSEDLLDRARARRPLRLLRQLEGRALHRGGHVTTTSHAMAQALATRYRAGAPAVVYNCLPWADRPRTDPGERERAGATPALHWVSQTIGPGRGLETLLEALRLVETPVAVSLRGHASLEMQEGLRRSFPSERGHSLVIEPPLPPAELPHAIARHDIGLALEPTSPANKDLTASNKIFHFLHAGLAIVATDTAGQREVAAAAPGAVELCAAGDPAALAAAITAFVSAPGRLAAARRAALAAAQGPCSWEVHAPRLLASVDRALHASPAHHAGMSR